MRTTKFHLLRSIFFLSLVIMLGSGCKKESTVEQIPKQDIIQMLTPSITITSLNSTLNPIDTLFTSFSIPVDTTYIINDHNVNRFFKLKLSKLFITNPDSVHYYKVWNGEKNKLTVINIDKYLPSTIYAAEFTFLVLEKINDKWEYIKSNNNSDNYVMLIKKNFNTGKISSDYVNCELGLISYLKNLSLAPGQLPLLELKHSLADTFLFSRINNTYGTGKAEITEFSIYENDILYPSTANCTNSNRTCSLMPVNLYKSNTSYKIVLKINYLEKKAQQWIQLNDAFGKALIEDKVIQFTTGVLNGTLIPKEFISFTYPMDRQHNFYRNEYDRGYYMFNFDLNKITQVKNVSDIKIRFLKYPLKQDTIVVNTIYEANTKTLWYNFPPNLENEKIYKVEMLSQNTVVHELNFRVSKYNSISYKISRDSSYATFLEDGTLSVGTEIYNDNNVPDEHFDPYERNNKLLKISALVNNWSWYQGSSIQYIYNHYPIIKEAVISRDTVNLGFPPVRSVEIWQTYNDSLTDEKINAGTVNYSNESVGLVIRTAVYMNADYKTTYNAIRQKYSSESQITDVEIKKIYNNSHGPVSKSGRYPFLIEYVLPGKNIVTFSKKYIINSTYTINDSY